MMANINVTVIKTSEILIYRMGVGISLKGFVDFFKASSDTKTGIGMVTAFVLIKMGTGEYTNFAKTAKEEIEKIEGVEEVYGVFGRYDIVVKIKTENLDELARTITDKIRSISGVSST